MKRSDLASGRLFFIRQFVYNVGIGEYYFTYSYVWGIFLVFNSQKCSPMYIDYWGVL